MIPSCSCYFYYFFTSLLQFLLQFAEAMISRLAFVFFLFTSSYGDIRGPRVKRIVGGVPALEPTSDDPTIFTNFAGKAARVHGVHEFPHYVFRGIKYALAPLGKDRFLRPREKLLQGIVNATSYSPPCIQPRPGTNQVIGSEDCLALNVFTPELPTGTEGLPVVVWIHGGGFRYGSASQYGVRHLVGKRLVVVTIQYRLGSLGFLSSGTKHLPGNVALWDMVLAVQWVRNYIGFFGGNPYKIIIMGHGTGASSALMVSLSNVAKGITSGIVAMSGTAVSNWATDNTPQHTATDVASQNGCPTADPVTMIKCLQSLPAESIIRGDSNVEFSRLQNRGFMGNLGGCLGTAPVTEGRNDGRSLPGLVQEEAMDEMDKGVNPKIPLMTGICKDETKRAVKGHLKKKIMDKLQKVPNFLQNDLIQKLREDIPLKFKIDLNKIKEDFHKGLANIENTLSKLVPPNFSNYVKVKKGNLFEALDKVADITNDALFNVPAFLTVDKWANNGAPTFLYSFEHIGKNKKGHTFLKGSPLVGNDTHNFEETNDTVGHGDDLAYLFDAYDIEGNPLDHEHNLTDEDIQVRDIFTQMIADFARFGAPKVNNKPVQPFSGKRNNFIQIRPKPVLADNFKFCEMALWCNIAERLKSTTCEFLKALDSSFKNMQNFAQGLLAQKNLTAEALYKEIEKIKALSKSGINIFNQSHLANLSPDKVFKDISNWKENVANGLKNRTDNFLNGFNGNNIFGKKDNEQENKTPKPNLFDLLNQNKNNNEQENKTPKPNLFDLLNKNKKDNEQENKTPKPNFLDFLNKNKNKNNEPENKTPKPNLLNFLHKNNKATVDDNKTSKPNLFDSLNNRNTINKPENQIPMPTAFNFNNQIQGGIQVANTNQNTGLIRNVNFEAPTDDSLRGNNDVIKHQNNPIYPAAINQKGLGIIF